MKHLNSGLKSLINKGIIMEEAKAKHKVTRKELKERIKELEAEVERLQSNEWRINYYQTEAESYRCKVNELEAYIRGLQGKEFNENKEN